MARHEIEIHAPYNEYYGYMEDIYLEIDEKDRVEIDREKYNDIYEFFEYLAIDYDHEYFMVIHLLEKLVSERVKRKKDTQRVFIETVREFIDFMHFYYHYDL